MFRRVPVSEMQTEVDVWEQLGKLRPGMHEMAHQRLPTQTGNKITTSAMHMYARLRIL